MTFGFIHAEKATYPIRRLCRALDVSPSGYYAWRARPASLRTVVDGRLSQAIRVVHAESRGRYGSPRILHVLRAHGHRLGRHRVMRLMRAAGLRARPRRRFRVTTDSQHECPVPTDLVRRRFRPAAANQIWVADMTYIETADGWLYLAVVLDLYSRRVVGWATRDTLHAELATAALYLALGSRRPSPGLVHHSDQGVQYASAAYRRVLAAHGVVASMSRRGECWDNAVAESFFSTLKSELETRRWPSRGTAATALSAYIDGFYNPVRLHSTLDYQAPNVFESLATM